MFNMSEIGNKISLLRKSANLTQMELANRLGISFQAVSNWERGISMPDISNLGALAEILGVSVDELIGDKKAADIITGAQTPESITVEEFNAVSPMLTPEKNRKLLESIGSVNLDDDNMKSYEDIGINVNIAACAFDQAELETAAERAFHDGNVGMFAILLKYLDGEKKNSLFCEAFASGNVAFTAMLARDEDSETLEKKFETAFNYGNCALVSILKRYVSTETLKRCLQTAVENGNIAMVAILSKGHSKQEN